MSITVRIPSVLRPLTGGVAKVAAAGDSLDAVIAQLSGEFPGLRDRLLDETGDLRSFVNVFVNGEDVRFLNGLTTPLSAGDEISIVPAAAGG